ncbi:UNVERIFIED_ORG: hypothetical protein GGE44_000948 [Rhizobium esperanzae]
MIDYSAIRALLTERGYAGYITIEQERDLRNTGGILDDMTASRGISLVLEEWGFEMTLGVTTIGRSSADLYDLRIGDRSTTWARSINTRGP